MPARLVFYPLMIFAIFIIYSAARGILGKKYAYPHLADLFITIAFTLDMLGNTLNLFNSIEWWDDLMHLVLWCFWILGIGSLLRMYSKLSRPVVACLAIGFGAVSSIIWELAEYITFVPNNPSEGPKAYRDTMGDELLSLSGSIIGALLISTILWRIVLKRSKR